MSSSLLVEVREAFLQPAVNVFVDLDVLVEGRLVELGESIRRGVRGRDPGVGQRLPLDGWELALDELEKEPEQFLGRVRRLGEVTGTMHSVLGSDPGDA